MSSIVWPNNAKLALSLVVNVEEGAESRVDEGDKRPEQVDELGISLKAPIRNYGNESNYAYGIKAGAPRIMALLERYGITATFTAAAVALERHWHANASEEERVANAHVLDHDADEFTCPACGATSVPSSARRVSSPPTSEARSSTR